MTSHCQSRKWIRGTNLITILAFLFAFSFSPRDGFAADRVRFAYPAKSLNYLPITIGRDKGIFQAEGIDLQIILVASTIQVAGLCITRHRSLVVAKCLWRGKQWTDTMQFV